MFSLVDNFIDQYSDSRTRGQYSIWEQIGIALFYIISVKKIGPWLMENRKPMDIKRIVMVFDAIQIVANFYFVIAAMNILIHMKGPYYCLELDSTGAKGKHSLYLTKFYYYLKISDLLDTVFFVMKKSWRQVSYLHVYHHSVMIFISWMAIKLVPGGHCVYFGLANSVVHTAMYTYYLLSAYDPSYKKNVVLKRTITQVQLIQFIFILFVFVPTIGSSCDQVPTFLAVAASSQAAYFFYLFGMFYYNTYIKTNQVGRQQPLKSK